MRVRRPDHATIVAYLALILALTTGGAYAIDRITSRAIENDTVRSADLRDRKAVAGIDVKRDTLGGKEVREQSLDGSALASAVGTNDAGDCDPSSTSAVSCVDVGLQLGQASRVFVVVTGGFFSGNGSPARAGCDVRVDGVARPAFASPGETAVATSSIATDGFARTFVTPDPLPAGNHSVALACWEIAGDVRIGTPTIAAIAISTGS